MLVSIGRNLWRSCRSAIFHFLDSGGAGMSLRQEAVTLRREKSPAPCSIPQGKRIHLLQPEKQGFPV